jgi:hypothetical protein
VDPRTSLSMVAVPSSDRNLTLAVQSIASSVTDYYMVNLSGINS